VGGFKNDKVTESVACVWGKTEMGEKIVTSELRWGGTEKEETAGITQRGDCERDLNSESRG